VDGRGEQAGNRIKGDVQWRQCNVPRFLYLLQFEGEKKIPASIEFKTSLTRLLFLFVHASIKIFMFECAIKERKFFFADKIKNSIDLSIPTFHCSFLYARTPVLSFLYSCSLYNETFG
jgi:hypothetical protein